MSAAGKAKEGGECCAMPKKATLKVLSRSSQSPSGLEGQHTQITEHAQEEDQQRNGSDDAAAAASLHDDGSSFLHSFIVFHGLNSTFVSSRERLAGAAAPVPCGPQLLKSTTGMDRTTA